MEGVEERKHRDDRCDEQDCLCFGRHFQGFKKVHALWESFGGEEAWECSPLV